MQFRIMSNTERRGVRDRELFLALSKLCIFV